MGFFSKTLTGQALDSGLFDTGGTSIEQVSTQTEGQRIPTELLLKQALQKIQGFRPDTRSRVRGPNATESAIFQQAQNKATQPTQRGGPQSRASQAQRGGQATGRDALNKGPEKRTDSKTLISEGMHSLLGKVLKNL